MNWRHESVVLCRLAVLGLALSQLAVAVYAQEDEPGAAGWSGTAEVTAVTTSGNAEAETFGLRTEFFRKWSSAELTLEAAGLRAESTTTDRFAVGTPDSFREVEVATTELTAENYLFRSRYDRSITDHVFLFVGTGWDRNTFAGVDNRYIGTLGAGHHWLDSENAKLTTTYGLTYTRQENVVGSTDSFSGVRLGYSYNQRLTDTTRFGSVLVADGNIDETSDYRADLTNWIKVAISDRLALKLSLGALYDNQPSLVALALFDEAGVPTDVTVLAPLDELDLLWTAALVVGF